METDTTTGQRTESLEYSVLSPKRDVIKLLPSVLRELCGGGCGKTAKRGRMTPWSQCLPDTAGLGTHAPTETTEARREPVQLQARWHPSAKKGKCNEHSSLTKKLPPNGNC